MRGESEFGRDGWGKRALGERERKLEGTDTEVGGRENEREGD